MPQGFSGGIRNIEAYMTTCLGKLFLNKPPKRIVITRIAERCRVISLFEVVKVLISNSV